MVSSICPTKILSSQPDHSAKLILQWNPSIMDTIGTCKLVLLIEVSSVEGSFNIIKYQKSVPCSEVSFIHAGVSFIRDSTVLINFHLFHELGQS